MIMILKMVEVASDNRHTLHKQSSGQEKNPPVGGFLGEKHQSGVQR